MIEVYRSLIIRREIGRPFWFVTMTLAYFIIKRLNRWSHLMLRVSSRLSSAVCRWQLRQHLLPSLYLVCRIRIPFTASASNRVSLAEHWLIAKAHLTPNELIRVLSSQQLLKFR